MFSLVYNKLMDHASLSTTRNSLPVTFSGNAEFAGVDNAGVVKLAIWVVIIIGYFNNRFMDFNGLFAAALMGNLNTYRPTYADCTQSSRFGAYTIHRCRRIFTKNLDLIN